MIVPNRHGCTLAYIGAGWILDICLLLSLVVDFHRLALFLVRLGVTLDWACCLRGPPWPHWTPTRRVVDHVEVIAVCYIACSSLGCRRGDGG